MGALLVAFLLVSYGILCGLRASVCRALLLGLGALWGRVHRKRASSTAFLGLGLLLLPCLASLVGVGSGIPAFFCGRRGLLCWCHPVEEKLAVWLPLPLARAFLYLWGPRSWGFLF